MNMEIHQSRKVENGGRYIDCVSGLLETQYLGLVGGGYL